MYTTGIEGTYGLQSYPPATPQGVTLAGELEGLGKLASELTRILQDADGRLSGRGEVSGSEPMAGNAIRPSVTAQIASVQQSLHRALDFANRIREQVG